MNKIEYYATIGVMGFCGGILSSEIVKTVLGSDIALRNTWLYWGACLPLMLLISFIILKISGIDKIKPDEEVD